MSLEAYYEFRRNLADALKRDIVGPSLEYETIEDDPINRYAAGVLYPQESGSLDPELDVDLPDDDTEEGSGAADPPVSLANVRYPSSMGLTFAVDQDVGTIKVAVSAARYAELPTNDKSEEVSPGLQPRRAGKVRRWQRKPLTREPLLLDVSRSVRARRTRIAEGLQLFCRVRSADPYGARPVTLVLLNTLNAQRGERDPLCFFQAELCVSAAQEGTSPFVERGHQTPIADDEDIHAYRLLYRQARDFAVGHGCSVTWEAEEQRPARAHMIRTTYVPEFALPLADSNPAIALRVLEFKFLTEGERSLVLQGLEELCSQYAEWIERQKSAAAALTPEYRQAAQANMRGCAEALERMRRGIAMLASNERAWLAFRLTNEVMLQQRARSEWLRAGKPGEEPALSNQHKWRPFQLAFVLLCLEGLADPHATDRDLADLLWFPTGGGKTEAYLGLIAFTVFLRRLSRSDGSGVTVLMRYTLRLLTLQQFERAAMVICCCENIRRNRTDLGKDPVSLGLWVGRATTPNTLADARMALDKLRAAGELEESNPVQLHSCPWCGYRLDYRNYWVGSVPNRLMVTCRQDGCSFAGGLPVFLVDEDVYRYRPSLIIATVDKFAGLPWLEEAADLFNIAHGSRTRQVPPELIIQDELHLISGPLGTLVGLYETAVDRACTENGVRPKVIASTATIRRAGHQARGLFNREIRQFPPPGLDAGDSFFAVEASSDARGTRMYVGLMAPGTSHATLLIRSYAALLQYAQDIAGSDAVKDPYWTLVGYFNSLRVLGGAKMQVQDQVQDRMQLLANRNGTTRREVDESIELTSREPSSRIPAHLRAMTLSLPEEGTLDYILATNMISVGVDIDRLGLMVVMGQPQSTSEYIQATSRVGRTKPGLVIVLYNAARSRDRSHYESFRAFHEALYRQVESTSVTPFSARARDKGLHAVLVALARLLIDALRSNDSAEHVAEQRSRLAEVVDTIVSRVAAVEPAEETATRRQLEDLLNDWQQRAQKTGRLRYRGGGRKAAALLRDASSAIEADGGSAAQNADEGFSTLWSLRDVDKESHLFEVLE